MLKIYNTYEKQKQEFKPLKDKEVKFYSCGPTVYWTQHLGNMRAAVLADLINRSLSYLGYQVKMVRNITDVGHLTSDQDQGEDKLEKGAKREGISPQEVAKKYMDLYLADIKKLNVKDPDVLAIATEYIDEMIAMVQILLDKGFAYTTDLAVYFDISKFKDYEKYSGQKLEEKIKGAGKGEVEDPDKKHPADFALWFFKAGEHQNALQTWPSPFESKLVENGQGFPGWHIECSAMSKENLGETIDLHMGGIEHIPIHHPNEIAQSEAANEAPFVKYWIHNEHLMYEGGKMSKSEGTAYSLTEVIEKGYQPLSVRYLFLQAHYRSKQNFTWESMEAADNGYEHLQNQVRKLGQQKGKVDKTFKNKFIDFLEDDFNIPQAFALIQELLKSDLNNQDKLATVLDFDQVLGLDLGKQEKIEIPKEVQELLEQRQKARDKKDWEQSDQLREQIGELGYLVEDTDQGQEVKGK